MWQRSDPSGRRRRANTSWTRAGNAVWLVDPGINGTHTQRPDGTTVDKFNAPKAMLMSYIIKGILDRQLPWALVLLGVMIAVTLEMSGVPSLRVRRRRLPAAVVLEPRSGSAGSSAGWSTAERAEAQHAEPDEEQLAAEGDKSPGVLLASGYIAGGAIAGIVIAFLAGTARTSRRVSGHLGPGA